MTVFRQVFVALSTRRDGPNRTPHCLKNCPCICPKHTNKLKRGSHDRQTKVGCVGRQSSQYRNRLRTTRERTKSRPRLNHDETKPRRRWKKSRRGKKKMPFRSDRINRLVSTHTSDLCMSRCSADAAVSRVRLNIENY